MPPSVSTVFIIASLDLAHIFFYFEALKRTNHSEHLDELSFKLKKKSNISKIKETQTQLIGTKKH